MGKRQLIFKSASGTVLLLSYIVTAVQALIVPEEIPSILSVVYSNIPPINTGIDSRIGLGFRLGPHADFQLLFDIGPQINTEKLNDESKRRRQTVQYVDTSSIKSSDENKQTNSPGSSWLSRWRSSLLASRNKAMVPVMVEESPVPSESGDPTKSGENFVSHLRKLYNKASN